MNVIKINKRIESGEIHIDGLENFIGKDAEIIVLIDEIPEKDINLRKLAADEFITSHSGKITPWNRDELHDR